MTARVPSEPHLDAIQDHFEGAKRESARENGLKDAQSRPLTKEEERIQEEAFAYAKAHRAALAREIVETILGCIRKL